MNTAVTDALKHAQALGLSAHDLKVLCEACHVKFGSILPPITGAFNVQTSSAGF